MSYIIYKICCDDLPEFIYVGSTKSFRHRKSSHKSSYNKGDTKKIYNTIRENGGWDNWRMVILEDIGEVSLTQARIKEEEHRVKLNANLNTLSCYLTTEQKKENKKQYFKNWNNNNTTRETYMKEWKEQNKEKINESRRQYYQKNKEKEKEYQRQLYHKKYIDNIINENQ
jgi:hypothetical protein